MEVVAIVDAITLGFQKSSDLTKRLQALRRRRREEDKFLEKELLLTLERAGDEVTQHRQLFVSECGFIVPREDVYLPQVDQLHQIKTAVEVFYSVLQVYCENSIPLKEPRKQREDADKWRFTTVNALTQLRQRLQFSRGQPSFSPPDPRTASSYIPSSGALQQHTTSPLQIQPGVTSPVNNVAHVLSPSVASPPDLSRFSDRSSQDSHDVSLSAARLTAAPRHSPVVETSPSRAASWAPESSPLDHVWSLSSNAIPHSPPQDGHDIPPPLRVPTAVATVRRPTMTNDERRQSAVTFATTSSSSVEHDSASSPSPQRRESFFKFGSSRRKSTLNTTAIESGGGLVRSTPSKKNDWHGFCQATFEIAENVPSGLQVVQRPISMHSNRLFLQCKRCAFPGNHFGPKQNEKTPDPTVMTSANGIRFRWLFLAKSHVKSSQSVSGDIKVQEHISRSAYRCIFCYMEGILPDKLGGLETLMNHIWQYHRGRNINKYTLRRAGCIIGRLASSDEQFEINIPVFSEEGSEGNNITAGLDSLTLSPSDDGRASTGDPPEPGPSSPRELFGVGVRQDPVELMGSCETYLVKPHPQ